MTFAFRSDQRRRSISPQTSPNGAKHRPRHLKAAWTVPAAKALAQVPDRWVPVASAQVPVMDLEPAATVSAESEPEVSAAQAE
jgi:hypothetical protein